MRLEKYAQYIKSLREEEELSLFSEFVDEYLDDSIDTDMLNDLWYELFNAYKNNDPLPIAFNKYDSLFRIFLDERINNN